MERFGITENFDADRSDPRNAAYLTPLANAAAEEGAQIFADAVHGAIADAQAVSLRARTPLAVSRNASSTAASTSSNPNTAPFSKT
jgi:hypothetical protein